MRQVVIHLGSQAFGVSIPAPATPRVPEFPVRLRVSVLAARLDERIATCSEVEIMWILITMFCQCVLNDFDLPIEIGMRPLHFEAEVSGRFSYRLGSFIADPYR